MIMFAALLMQVLFAIERNPAADLFVALARGRQGTEDYGHGHLVVHLLLVTFLRVAPAVPGAGAIEDDSGSTRREPDIVVDNARCVDRRLSCPLGRLFKCKS